MRIGTLVVLVWLLIGVFATWQRGYFGDGEKSCAELGTTVVAIVSGPLNYVINPTVDCPDLDTPQPAQ